MSKLYHLKANQLKNDCKDIGLAVDIGKTR